MKILLTGPCGRHGFYTLLRLLDEGHEVRAFDTRDGFLSHPAGYHEELLRYVQNKGYELEWRWGDIRDADAVRDAVADDIDAVIHHAAMTMPSHCGEEWEYCWDVNYYGTLNVISAVQRSSRSPKLIYSSSVANHGYPVDGKAAFTETDGLPSTCTYAATKIASELAIQRSGINYTIMRMATVGEPGFPEVMLIARYPHLRKRVDTENHLKGVASPCHLVSTDDVNTAYLKALDNRASDRQVFLIAGPESCRTTFKAYTDRMHTILGVEPTSDEDWGMGPYPQMYYDIAHSNALLNYASTEFEHIFEKTLAVAQMIPEFIELSAPATT